MGGVKALFIGLAIGAIFGILFAPKSGKETRNDLAEKGERLMEMGIFYFPILFFT